MVILDLCGVNCEGPVLWKVTKESQSCEPSHYSEEAPRQVSVAS